MKNTYQSRYELLNGHIAGEHQPQQGGRIVVGRMEPPQDQPVGPQNKVEREQGRRELLFGQLGRPQGQGDQGTQGNLQQARADVLGEEGDSEILLAEILSPARGFRFLFTTSDCCHYSYLKLSKQINWWILYYLLVRKARWTFECILLADILLPVTYF